LEESDTDLILFIICQLALRVEKRVFPFLEFHKNFAMNQIFCILSNKNLAKKIYNKFNFHYSDLKDLTLCNPNGMELAYFFNGLDMDYTQLKQKRGFFGLFYRIRKKVMKLKVGRISDLIKRFSERDGF
jgi:hypothetical protein